MYLPNTHNVINHELYRDRLREIEHLQLLRLIERQSLSSKIYRRTISWLGTQLVNLGTKLQNFQNTDTGCQETSNKISMTVH